jgi:N-acetylglutamate synthase-like GNAT family acetyltransferase
MLHNANENDLEEIYMMGYDVWSDGLDQVSYIESCKKSEKYKKGQFKTLVEDHKKVASLIVYSLAKSSFGIGSIAVPINLRNKGYGSKIVQEIVLEIKNKNTRYSIFLFSDIDIEFYKKLGFIELPKVHQNYKNTTCMILTNIELKKLYNNVFKPPEYF